MKWIFFKKNLKNIWLVFQFIIVAAGSIWIAMLNDLCCCSFSRIILIAYSMCYVIPQIQTLEIVVQNKNISSCLAGLVHWSNSLFLCWSSKHTRKYTSLSSETITLPWKLIAVDPHDFHQVVQLFFEASHTDNSTTFQGGHQWSQKSKAELCNLSMIWLVNGICKSPLELCDTYLKHNMVILKNNVLGKMVCNLESLCHNKWVFNRKIES